MDTNRDSTPDPDLVTPETDPTPDGNQQADEQAEGERDLAAFERFAGRPVPTEGTGPLP